MRILLCLASATGGIGAHVADLADRLAGAGHEVSVVTDPATRARFDLPGRHPLRPSSVHALAGLADVVHAHGFRAGATVALAGVRAPLVVSLHNPVRGAGLSPRRVAGGLAARTVLGRADLVTGASSDLVADALALGARRAELARVSSPRVPVLLTTDREEWRAAHRDAWLARHGLPTDAPFVLTIARVAPQKGIDTLAAAAEHGAGTWGLVGPGQTGLAGRVGALQLLGETADVAPWLLSADLLVVPSEWEARALVVQEAMAAGTPVVAFDVGGLPDLIDGVGALVRPAEGAPGLVRAVDHLVDDPDEGFAAAERARERARDWPGPDDTANEWTLRYAELLS